MRHWFLKEVNQRPRKQTPIWKSYYGSHDAITLNFGLAKFLDVRFPFSTADHSFLPPCGAKTNLSSKGHQPKYARPEVEVQIMNLMDTYDKKTKKCSGKYEYGLGSSEVTIVARASDEIKRVRVYVQRCPDAAIRTHDTTGSFLNRVKLENDSTSLARDNFFNVINHSLLGFKETWKK